MAETCRSGTKEVTAEGYVGYDDGLRGGREDGRAAQNEILNFKKMFP